MAIGKCLLTGATGTFVKSHLTPQAFTAPAIPGAYFVSAGNRMRPSRTFTSWYDKKIVTRKGEDILADLDSYAVTTLRRHKLVWSGWDGGSRLDPGLHRMFNDTQGFRKVLFEDAQRIRLFCLSLLWRWSVSTLPAAAEVDLPIGQQHQLRDMILASDAGDPSVFPIEFIQLSTRGEAQNMAPIATMKSIHDFESSTEKTVSFYRFYFDGLAVHVGMSPKSTALHTLVLGAETDFTLATVAYEDSFQRLNLNYLKQDVNHEFPREFQKFILPFN